MNMIEWLLSEKIAKHWKQAQNIIVGLELNKLYDAKDYDGIKARARLYRDWRNAGEPSKVAFQHAINGDVIQALPMEGALLSEDEWQDKIHKSLMENPDDHL